MKAVRIHSYGKADQLKLEETERPVPKENEILVQIHDAGVNPIDWKIRAGHLKEVRPANFPLTMGHDFAGEILEVGSAVQGFAKGERVCGFVNGSYAEFAVTPARKIAKIPESMSFEAAASLPTAGLTAYQIVMNVVKPFPEQTVLIHGAAGGVGSIAAQLLIHRGAHVFGTASEKDIPYLHQLNVTRAINYKTENFEDYLDNIDVVIDLVGGDTQKRSFSVLKKGGLLVTTVGLVEPDLPGNLGIEGVEFYMEPNGSELEALVKDVEKGIVEVRVAQVVPLAEARSAQEINETGNSRGKIIIRVA